MNEPSFIRRGDACLLCGAAPLTLWRRGNLHEPLQPRHFAVTDYAYGKTLDLFCCSSCGLLQCGDTGGVLAHYEQLEDDAYEAGRAQRALQMRGLLMRLRPYAASGALLDIGAATGMLVEEALRLGYAARGVEPSRAFQAVAARRGLPVILGTLPHADLTGPFDIVTLVDVLEHVDDPVGLLRGAVGILRPGGIGLLVTPNVRSLAARLMGARWWHYRPAHITYFDRHTVRRLLQTCGVQVLAEFRPTWVFPLDYLWERAVSYLPRRIHHRPPRLAASIRVPLNLGDSVALIFRRPPATMSAVPYIKIARLDHWVKNILVLPGTFIAAFLIQRPAADFVWRFPLGMLAACLVCSANYVLNEWLDAHTDRFHPTKRFRPSVAAGLRRSVVAVEYLGLAVVGVGIGFVVSVAFGTTAMILLLMGVLYNVPPLRTKDRVVVDVLSESFNNPLRLAMGWFIVTTHPLPPSSLLVSYWMGGAFLMAIKRFAEFRQIGNQAVAGSYRRTFRYYSEETLLISSVFYAMFCGLLLGVFLVKYRVELLLLLPFVALHFAWYFHLAFLPDSPAQYPERLYKQHAFALFTLLVGILFVVLLSADVPILHWLLQRVFVTTQSQLN